MNCLVLMGGMSAEREISLKTGKAVSDGLHTAGYEVKVYDLDPGEGRDIAGLVSSSELAWGHVVFIALHGGEGEDGRIQALLELLGKPYTGSGVLASALCMDKALSKMLFERNGIRTPPWIFRDKAELDSSLVLEALRDIGDLPVIVKPVDQGSTIGVSIVNEPEELGPAIALALRYSDRLIFEKYIAGRELSVAIVGNNVFPVIEIVPENGFYDYERKYTKGKSSYCCPAEIDSSLSEQIMREAAAAYSLLGCRGFGRVDLRLGDDGMPYFLEINTIPGMTETSLVPMAAKVKGYSFSQLVDLIVKESLKRSEEADSKAGG